MKRLDRAKISHIVSKILDNIAFLPVDIARSGAPKLSQHASISFSGSGEESELCLSANEGFLIELAANIIGAEPEDICAATEGSQALTELANIVCGEVVIALGAADMPFVVGLPREQTLSPRPEGAEHLECEFVSDSGRLRVSIVRQPS